MRKTRILLILSVVATVLLDCLFACAHSSTNHLVLLDGDKLSLECVWIAPGRFLMGSPASDSYAAENEKPQREVRIEKGFFLG